MATLLLMQNRGRVTAAELAAELEVSVATARRDLEALSTAGIPVYSLPGRGGGWELVGGARTNLSGLTAPEAQALFLLLGPAATAAPGVRSALRKLLRALPETFRTEAEAAADAVVIDPVGWGGQGTAAPPLVERLQRAVVRRERVELVYERAGERSRRRVDPWGLVDKDALWYLIAGTDRGQRTFRVDRIVEATGIGETFERPADFELSAAWEQVVDEVEQHRATTSATVLISERLAPILQHQQGRHCVVDGPIGDGRVQVRITAPTPLMVAQQLAGWGSAVDVVEPPSVRDELGRLGSELVERYR
ncbi:putative DNA-binding transcriptional regulator YafY [Nocardia mexicana]|uniref:Putative DNA-binding transcriptional regulator YafY n=1 Tax=Nocardia mexicana TaxID=279262 RepID=A0A370H8Y2_9NOCA|nr:putative DNA-binding transcriptional regulator YafY [Nocardia mexicana]